MPVEKLPKAQTALRMILAGSLVLASLDGCANGGTPFSTRVDASDVCGQQHAAFADSKSFYLQEIATGTLLGGAGGALLGALTASATGGDAGKGALIGFGAGAVAGGVAGYANASQQDAKDRAALANSVYGNVSQATEGIDRATTSFGLLRDCRFSTAARIKAAVQTGSLSRDQASQQLADQRRRFQDELILARQYGAKMAEQDDKLRSVSNDLLKDDPQAQTIVASRAKMNPYVTRTEVNIRSAPSDKSEIIGQLAKGQTVYAMPDPASNGWRQIVLDDGRSGYTAGQGLTLAASAAPTAAAEPVPPKPPLQTANRNAQIAVATTETIPEKRIAYSKAVDTAAQQSTLSFDLNQAGPSA